MGEKNDKLLRSCDHLPCSDYGGREEYCAERGEDAESDIPIVLDQLEDVMFSDIDTASGDVAYSTNKDYSFMERSFNYLEGDFKGYSWPLTEREVHITRQTIADDNKIIYTVSLGWKVHQQKSAKYAPYTTEYFIEVGDGGVEATVYENDINPEDILDPSIGPMGHARVMTPYDHIVLFESLSEVAVFQKAQVSELAAAN